MNTREITQDELEQLIEDISYLQDEAEALRYVIDSVPVTEKPPGGRSIAEMLLLIGHAQRTYYRPVLEEAVGRRRPLALEEFEDFRETFTVDKELAENVQKMLGRLAKHRAGFANAVKQLSLIDWETVLLREGKELMLFDFMREMVRFERSQLKEVADQVMVFNQDRQARREIERRHEQNSQP